MDLFDRRLLLVSLVFSLLSDPSRAMRPAVLPAAGALYLQDSVAGTPLGKLNVPPGKMAARCITMVSPNYPQTTQDSPATASVEVRVVIWKTGKVSPLRVISGPAFLETEAMNVVRLWQYKPFLNEQGEPLDVTTDVQVNFDARKPGGTIIHPHS